MEGDSRAKLRVAVVGSGMAGLATAYLLNQDPEKRYDAEAFESGDQLSLDSSSLSVTNPKTGAIDDRVDLPMRTFSGGEEGYYGNLRAMYDYLEVEYRPQRFLFAFTRIATELRGASHKPKERLLFTHASNNHILFPIRPQNSTLLSHLFEIGYLIVWSYAQRTHLPKYFVSNYLLPLFSSVATCSHEELLEFPALDFINYKIKTSGAHHYAVSGGVRQVQIKLSQGLRIRKSAMVVSVEPQAKGIKLCWKSTNDLNSKTLEAIFDKVILAVAPNVVQAIFKPLSTEMSQIPTITVQSIVHTDDIPLGQLSGTDLPHSMSAKALEKGSDGHILYLRTFTEDERGTESIHVQPSGLLVTTCPISDISPEKTIQTSTFTRVLRTTTSRQIVNDIFDRTSIRYQDKGKTQWRNGDDGVWIVGGWCWDGLVLLEGCITSSMIVAHDFGIKIPWRVAESSVSKSAFAPLAFGVSVLQYLTACAI